MELRTAQLILPLGKNDGVALSFRVKDVDEACEYLEAKTVESQDCRNR
ncbi:hypothetical protein [Leptolyngbya sp. BC1307]|nr:hypothetical protein [Leptolyngbya sp. BC1307]